MVGLFKLRALLSAYGVKICILLTERTHYYSKFFKRVLGFEQNAIF